MISSVIVIPVENGQRTCFIGSNGKPWISFDGLPKLLRSHVKWMPPGKVSLWGEFCNSSEGFWFCSVTFTDPEGRHTYSVYFRPITYGTCYIHVHGSEIYIPMSRSVAIKKLVPLLGLRFKKVKGKDDYYFA